MGLDEDMIRYSEPACLFSLVESINLILFLNGSDFEIEEVQERTCLPRPVPSEKHVAWSVSSTYPSSGSAHVVLPDPKPKPPKKMAAAASKARHEMAAPSLKPPKEMAAAASKSRHEVAAAKLKQPRTMAAAAPEPLNKVATAKHKPPIKMSAAVPEPQNERDHWLIDFWSEPVAPSFHESAPSLQKPAPVLHESGALGGE
ncbi:hypothetical protein DPX16_22602 [Anabarilius grahami]|uniref:Uncharacterized protein n=1 Tax=Anabarilius grahami TaxID=495550 RepID=A0A3N0XHT0_ANAGA|nr:hypothetical protein DPX16_22602 [Anabarilius grahami]